MTNAPTSSQRNVVELSQERGRVVRLGADPGGLFGDPVEFARAPDGTFSKIAVPSGSQVRSAYGATSPFAATKALLRDLAGSGVVVRRSTDIRSGAGSIFRDRKSGENVIQVARNVAGRFPNPAATLAHEAGHIRNPSPATFRQYATAADRGQDAKAAILAMKQERAANRGALDLLKQYGTSRDTRNAYRAAVMPHYSSYRNEAAAALVRDRGTSINAPMVTDAVVAAYRKGASPVEIGRIVEKVRKNLIPGYADAKRSVSVANRGEFRKAFMPHIPEHRRAELERRATINRIIDASQERISRPELPYEKEVTGVARASRVLRTSPIARAAILRAAKIASGAAVGGYLGYRYKGKAGVGPGIKTGAVAGLLFSQPEAHASVCAGVLFAAKLKSHFV